MILAGALAFPSIARPFCGFYVGRSSADHSIRTSSVLIVRDGENIALTIRNDPEGPVEDLAFVMPVPASVRARDVNAVSPGLFDAIEQDAAPELEELREEDPCPPAVDAGPPTPPAYPLFCGRPHGRCHMGCAVTPDDLHFVAGEYAVSLHDTCDPAALERDLAREGYVFPPGASATLAPYLRAGMNILVARIAASRLSSTNGRTELTPLQVRYRASRLVVPIAPGLRGASGPRDLFVHVIADGARYEVANRPNVTVPTNLDVGVGAGRFGRFYTALFDHIAERAHGAVVTEHAALLSRSFEPGESRTLGAASPAWMERRSGGVSLGCRPLGDRDSVDPRALHALCRSVLQRRAVVACLERAALAARHVGGRFDFDVTLEARGVMSCSETRGALDVEANACLTRALSDLQDPALEGQASLTLRLSLTADTGGAVLTRLHLRHEPGSPTDDLALRPATPLAGGDDLSASAYAARPALANNFLARYAIRTPWTSEARCANPRRGRWRNPHEPSPCELPPDRSSRIALPSSTSREGEVSLASLLRTRVEGLPEPLAAPAALVARVESPPPRPVTTPARPWRRVALLVVGGGLLVALALAKARFLRGFRR
jgi:hypothetical protein